MNIITSWCDEKYGARAATWKHNATNKDFVDCLEYLETGYDLSKNLCVAFYGDVAWSYTLCKQVTWEYFLKGWRGLFRMEMRTLEANSMGEMPIGS